MLERFISAECSACWSAAAQDLPGADTWLFDWIVPTTAGDKAALSAAAPPESRERALRGLGEAPAATQTRSLRHTQAITQTVRLSVEIGPAWSGYLGVQLKAQGAVSAGATAWLALVELLPAGTDGSTVARELVRTVAGPLPLQALHQGKALSDLRALRWPDGALPERLQARAWIEAADGRFIAVAAGGCPARS